MSKVGKEKLISLFWKLLPFIITAPIIGCLLIYNTKDVTYFYVFIPFVTVILLPFSAAVVCMVRAINLTKALKVPLSAKVSDPQLNELGRKTEKWMGITLFNALAAFLVITLIAVHFVKAERKVSPFQIVKINQPKNMSEGSEINDVLNVLNTVLRHLWKVSLTAVAIAIILILILIGLKKVPVEKPGPVAVSVMFVTAGLFIAPIITGFIIGNIMEKIVLREVRFFLSGVSPAATVVIQGKPADNDVRIVEELAKVTPVPTRNSNYTKRFRIKITDGNQGLIVDLARDSEYKQEYWVFYPGYGYTSANEIGRIRTNLFDGY